MEQLVTIIALITSIIIHEMAHGYAANALGDPTARLQGRLTGNPLVHIDPIGSILIPGLLFFSNAGILFGWAKPVPYNPYNLTNQKWGEALVAAAGPGVNVLLALIFGIVYRVADTMALSQSFLHVAWYIVYINILLAIFNSIPIPPLDGSKMIMPFLPYGAQMRYRQFQVWVERYGLILMFVFIFIFINFFSHPFFILVSTLVSFVTGSFGA